MNEYQQQLCSESTWDFSDVRALFVNGTLKPSPGVSNTEGLARIAIEIMEANSVTVDTIRAVDHDIAAGVYPDMRDHGAASDEWPDLYERVMAADICADDPDRSARSSVCAASSNGLWQLVTANGTRPLRLLGKVGGASSRHEDGVKHCRWRAVLAAALGTPCHAGHACWLASGPGPSYSTPDRATDNDLPTAKPSSWNGTQEHTAGRSRTAGDPRKAQRRQGAGCRFDVPNDTADTNRPRARGS